MTRVMMVVATSSGGVARHVTEVALGCLRRGLAVQVVCPRGGGVRLRNALGDSWGSMLAVDEIDIGLPIHPIRHGTAIIRLSRLVERGNIQVLHLHSSTAGVVGRLAALGLRRAPYVVYSPHAYAFLTQSGAILRSAYWLIERVLVPLTDRIVALSQGEVKASQRLCAPERIALIPNGVARLLPRKPKGPSARLRIGWLGRMTWQKDPSAAVWVSVALYRSGVDHELLLGGDGPALSQVAALVQRLGAQSYVRMLGFVSDTSAFHAANDVFLMTSRCEGLPYVALDAMAHGTPIVAFSVPGVADLVEHGVTGWLAPPGRPDVLSAHLAVLARDDRVRRAAGAAAENVVRTRYQLEEHIDRLTGLYRSLAGQGAVTPVGYT